MQLYDINVQGNTVTIPALSVEEGHRWLSALILDGQLPVWAPIGMQCSVIKRANANNRIDNSVLKDITVPNSTFIETGLSIISNMRGLVFTGLHKRNVIVNMNDPQTMAGLTGKLSFDESPMFEVGRPGSPVKALAVNKHFATSLSTVSIQFLVSMSTGSHTMAQNASDMATYFPYLTDGVAPVASFHDINNYLRIWAEPVNGQIKVTYLNGFSADMFIKLWEEAKEYGND